MNENEVVEEINEEVLTPALNESNYSNGNVLIKVAVATIIAAAGVCGFILYRKNKKKIQKIEVVDTEEVISEESETIDEDNEK